MKLQTKELKELQESKAEQIRLTFEPMAKMLEGFEAEFNEILNIAADGITKEICERAKRCRIDISKVRIETEKERKKQKAEYLIAGKAIDGVSNILQWAVSEKEDKLKEVENYFDIQEQKRLNALQLERQELLSQFVADAEERNLSSMDEDVWQAYLHAKQKAYNDRIEAERKAEVERKAREAAEAAERKRIIEENERLKAEREKQARLEAERKAKAEAEAKALRKKAEEAERKAKAEAEAKQKAYEAALKAEREKQARLEAEIKAKAEAEAKQKAEAEALRQAELKKGDAEKVADLLSDLVALKGKYFFKSAKYQKIYGGVCQLIDKVINYIKQ